MHRQTLYAMLSVSSGQYQPTPALAVLGSGRAHTEDQPRGLGGLCIRRNADRLWKLRRRWAPSYGRPGAERRSVRLQPHER